MMDDDRLKAIVEAEIREAMGNFEGDLSVEREKSLEYYFGKPYGDESNDRSQIVTREMLEAVENAMPSLIRIFTASGQYVEFDPVGPDDVQQAQVDTEAVRYVFSKQNEGFDILYTWFKDALRQKNGIVKTWYEEAEEVYSPREEYTGLTDDELAILNADPEVEITEHTQTTMEMPAQEGGNGQTYEHTVHDVVLRRSRMSGQVMIENIPPEEFLISADARNGDPMQARFICHRTDKMVAELRDMGVDEEILDDLATGSDIEHQSEQYARNQAEDEYDTTRSEIDRDRQRVTLYECRLMVDYDEDGSLECRKIVYVGNHIIENVEATGPNKVCYRAVSPFPQPHRFLGMSYFDMLEDVQHVQSILLRNSLDAIYKANENRTAYWEGMVDVEDLADRRFDGLIACSRAPQETILPIPQQNIPPQTFDLMNRMDQIARRRTGVGEGVSGLSEDALSNAKTGVVQSVMERGSEQLELIARVFAETGVKHLFLDIHGLLRENHYHDLVMRLGEQFVAVNPSRWRDRKHITVNVGLGTGNKDRDLSINREIRQTQQAIVENGGMNILVTPQNLYHTMADLIDIAGKRDPSRYFMDPGPGPMQVPQQGQQGEGEGDSAQAQAYLQAEQMKAQQRAQDSQMKAQLQAAKQQSDEAFRRYELAQKHLEKMTELELKYEQNVPGAAV